MKFITLYNSTFSAFEKHQRHHCGDLSCCEKWSISIMQLQQSWCLKAALSTLYCSHTFENFGSFLMLWGKKNGEEGGNAPHPNPGWQNQVLSMPGLAIRKRQCKGWSAKLNHEVTNTAASIICQLFQVKTWSVAMLSFNKNSVSCASHIGFDFKKGAYSLFYFFFSPSFFSLIFNLQLRFNMEICGFMILENIFFLKFQKNVF